MINVGLADDDALVCHTLTNLLVADRKSVV